MENINIYGYRHFTRKDFPFDIKVRSGENFPHANHAHESLQICYVKKGSCIHRIYGCDCTIAKGDMILIPSFVNHSLHNEPDSDVLLIQVDFLPVMLGESATDGDMVDSLLDFAYLQPFIYSKSKQLTCINLSPAGRDCAEALLSSMQKEFEAEEYGYKISIKADLLKLLVILSRELSRNWEGGLKRQADYYHRQIFEDISRYLENNYHEKIKLEDIAGIAHMSPVYISYLFKKNYGQSFTGRLSEIRIQKAALLLRTKDASITDIAFDVGFNHIAHFNKTFKRIMDVTPMEYRRQQASKNK